MQKTVIKAVPFVSVNGIEFGTSREKIRETLGKPEYSFFKDDDKIETDILDVFTYTMTLITDLKLSKWFMLMKPKYIMTA